MPFARIATVAALGLLVGLAGCGHEPRTETVVAPAAAATGVPREAASGEPALAAESPAPQAAVPEKPAPKKKPAAKADPAVIGGAALDRFVAAVQQRLPEVALDRRDEEVEDLGEQACDALKGGRSATAAAGGVVEQGVTPADARMLVGLAKDNLCRT
ncbi:DUF732 domain-containing protein [Actinoplanes sp. NPDC051343]|uniref:DUF732 domain-containing protein n=1 Tax=Actinoplanes sp. NPDC051343 TaxID=3363906 RepID=UPI0037B60606